MSERIPYLVRLQTYLEANQNSFRDGIDLLSREIVQAGTRKGNVWLIGNGGSASTAEHLETDLAFVRHGNKNMPQISSLISNSALISAVSNDISYDEVFKVILQRKARGGDLLIAISASGNSKNILKSLQWAKSEKIKTISILGFDGGLAQEMSDSSVVIMTELGEYGIVEDIHLSLCHAVAEEIITGFKD